MKLSMNGELYDVPRAYQEKLMTDLLNEGRKDYQQKLDSKWRVIAMAPARLILQSMERHVAKSHGPEAAKAIRPAKGADPVEHLAWVFSRMILEGLKHVELSIGTDQGIISAFNLNIESPSEAGRFVGLDRGERERQIDGAKIS